MSENIKSDNSGETEIDLLDLFNKLWAKRKFIIKCMLIGFVAGIIIAFSIPKEYATLVQLVPDTKQAGSAGGMGALAAMAGVNLQQNSEDAISPEIYPNIVGSTPFIVGLFDVKVQDKKQGIDNSLYNYLLNDQKKTWWSYILGAPSKLLGLFSSNSSERKVGADSLSEIVLSRKDLKILDNLKDRIVVSVDKKTNIISLTVTMQSPEISAFVADTVTSYLQDYVIKYRTQKARKDLSFTEKLFTEAKADYYKSQQNYASYSDGNLDIVSARYGAASERLQNEMNLAYGVYSQMAQQLQMAKVKVQDTTPVYSVIQPAVVPLIPEKPKKKLIVIGFLLLALIGSCGWILGAEFLSKSIKK